MVLDYEDIRSCKNSQHKNEISFVRQGTTIVTETSEEYTTNVEGI